MTYKINKGIKTISVSGQDDVVSDLTEDTITLIAGSNVTLTTNATNDSITIASSGSGGGGISFDGSTANGVLSYKDADEAAVESNLTFDGTDLVVAGGGKVAFRDNGGEYIYSVADNTLGIVAATEIDLTATTIDINGAVDISGNATVGGDIILDDGGSLKEAGGTAAITFDGSGHVTKIGQDSPSSGQFLKWDGSKAVWDSASGGGGGSTIHYIETFPAFKTLSSGASISDYTTGIDKELLSMGGYGFNQIKDYIMTSADGSTWTTWDNSSTSDLDQHYFRNQVTGDSGYSSGAYGDDGYFQSKVIASAHVIPVTGTITKVWLKGQQLDGGEIRMRAWMSTSGVSNSANGSSGMTVGASGAHFVFKELNDGESSPTFWDGIKIGGNSTYDYFQEYETLSGYDVTAGQLLMITFDALGDTGNRKSWTGLHYMFEITAS